MERQQWRIERAARVLLLLLVAAALIGLFGPGPISWATESSGALTVTFDRFVRRGGTTSVGVKVAAEGAAQGRFVVRVTRRYLENFALESITPRPESVRVDGHWIAYTFETDDPTGGLLASFALTPKGLWAADGRVALPGGDTVTPAHFIYP